MRCERTMREVRLNAGKQQGSAPRAVDWPVRSPATFTRCDLSLSKTPNGAILPQNHSESGECRLKRAVIVLGQGIPCCGFRPFRVRLGGGLGVGAKEGFREVILVRFRDCAASTR